MTTPMPPRQRRLRSIEAVAETQHGIATRSQAVAAGLSDSAIGRCVGSGEWKRVHRGIYRIHPAGDRYAASLTAAVLRAPGCAWASHRAAAALWGLLPQPQPVEISTTSNVRSAHILIHHVSEMPAGDRSARNAIAVTAVERTLVDLGGVAPRVRLEAAAVEAIRRGLTSPGRLADRVVALEDRGRAGPRQLRELLKSWGQAAAPESVLESRLRRLLRRFSLPPGIAQLEVRDGDFVARLDLAYPRAMVAVEVDGYRWHGDRSSWRSDLARRNRLTRLGWRVLHFTWNDVTREPEKVAAEIRRVLASPARG